MKSIFLRLSFFLFSLGTLMSLGKPAWANDGKISFDLPNDTSVVRVALPVETSVAPTPSVSPASSPTPLTFTPAPSSPPPPVALAPAPMPQPASLPPAPDPALPDQAKLFAGGSDSLVARAVGHAEGTRTPDGGKTSAYYGHPDPGNGVWNLGSFSFQHCREASYSCASPDEADFYQLRRLEGQAEAMRQRAVEAGAQLSLEAELNGIDLANQAPAAALGQPGYVEWLDRAEAQGLQGQDAVLWARVSSYWDPQLRGWDAPGLGNSEPSITHDQQRRMTAIARVLESNPELVAQVVNHLSVTKLPSPPLIAEAAPQISNQKIVALDIPGQ